jgi:hypothetical protein
MDKDELKQLEKQKLTEEFGIGQTRTSAPILHSGTETPTGTLTFNDLSSLVEQYLPNTATALKLLLAVATSGVRKNRGMLWLMFVGSPSSGKTELLRLIKSVPMVTSLDTLTQNSFISGERETSKQKVYDLLPKLDGKCLVIKDWTVIFSHDERMTKKIIGDLVGIYDKSLAKSSSQRGVITYESEFSHLGAITPATLNKHHNYLNMIGPRFLFYTIPSLNQEDEDKSFDAIFSNADRKELERRVSAAVFDYLVFLNEFDLNQIEPLSKEVQNYLKTASRFMAKGRGIVIIQQTSFKNEGGEEITYYEPLEVQIEQPFRAVQQLMTLSEYLALVVGKSRVNEEELEVIKEIVISSMPADRSQALRALKASENGEITAKQLSEGVDVSTKTARRLLEELTNLGVVEKVKGSGQIAASYKIADSFRDFVLLTPREFLSLNKSELKESEVMKIFSEQT